MTFEQTIQEFLLKKITEAIEKRGLFRDKLTEDTNLLDSGLIESLELLFLISQVEQVFSVDLDFSEASPEDFMTIRNLAARCAAGRRR
jgi:acyl carrier protein